MQSFGSRSNICKTSLRFFSPPEKTVHQVFRHVHDLHLLADQCQEVHRVQLLLAAVAADRVEGRLEEVMIPHPGDLHRILKGEKDALPGSLLGFDAGEITALVEDLARRDRVAGTPREQAGQGALARAVGAHHGVDLARSDGQIDPSQDFGFTRAGVKIHDLEHDF